MSLSQEFNCIFCKETFGNKEDLQIHFRKHGDPKFNQKGKSRSSNDGQAGAEKKSEEVEMVSCDVCPEMFPTISKAITHKHKVHPDHDAKYFCPWCGKLFTMKHLYNKHLQSNHTDLEKNVGKSFHCDVCGVDFFVPSAMLYHNKFFHRQDTDLPTIGQSKKLKMIEQEVLQIYYCAFCGDEYDNKVNLHKHMADDHGDENQSPEEVLRCPLCEAIFYHLDAYEVHLTFHSTDDLYTEKNEIFEQIDEFSLETVPPVVEKVEIEPQEDVESAMNAVGIDKFLEMAMGDTLGKDTDGLKSKSKKHKKHKKKKKEAITLDEFLNMNTDVFGEGLAIQGIEEVPTQVVAKRLKQNKIGTQHVSNLKVAQSSELEKLKKQGIVVKMKAIKKPPMQYLKIGNKIAPKPTHNVNKASAPNVQSSPDDVLSKLINQSNSQIKIVKKSSQAHSEPSPQKNVVEDNTVTDKRSATPENIEIECDVNMPSEYASSENETKEDFEKKSDATEFDKKEKTMLKNSDQSDSDQDDNKNQNSQESSPINMDKSETNKEEDIVSEPADDSKKDDQGTEMMPKDKHMIKVIAQTAGNPATDAVDDTNKVGEKFNEDPKTESADTLEENNPDNSTNNSLNALKHLSHLITVKSVIPKKNAVSTTGSQIWNSETTKKEPLQSYDDPCIDEGNKTMDDSKELSQTQINDTKETPLNSLHSLKNISKNITIKPVAHSPKSVAEKSDNHDYNSKEDINNHNLTGLKVAQNTPESPVTGPKSSTTFKNPDNDPPSPRPQGIKKNVNPTNVKETQKVQEKQSSIDLLKHLTNVTAKPVNTMKSNIQQNSANKSNKQFFSKPNVTQNIVKNQEINEDIEIFNIDDSDDEPDNETTAPLIKTESLKPNSTDSQCVKRFDTLKNISKHITVKPLNQRPATPTNRNIKEINPDNRQSAVSDFSDDDDDDDQNILMPSNFNTVQQKLRLQNENLKNTLKHIGKHITVKSGNPSPNSSIKSGKDYRDNDMNDAPDSDDSSSGKVKITEMNDDNGASDDELGEQYNKNKACDEKSSVKSPPEANSEHDNNDDIDEPEDDEFSDLEHQIKASTLTKPSQKVNHLMNFKNMNKDITIKSLQDKKVQGMKEVETNVKNIIPNINSALSIKPVKQIKSECSRGNETFSNKKNMMNAAQVKRSIINQNQSVNQSMASSSQHNTVNKEVTVKTFQTKTVIQEITTTVTKTIKTVNQTVKQEVQSTSQCNPVKFQKVQTIKSNQQIKNFQGMTVRHATPVAGTKIRGTAPTNNGSGIRPANQLVPSNQLVPFRPPRNIARMSVPRMPAVRRSITAGPGTQPRPSLGRPLKISPNVVSTTKRPTEEPIGHFSCFKKPKESLIPGSEIPSFGNEQGSESVVQFSSSQMSKSNFTSATKTVRGNTVVTQTKSEVSASSQQLEKLNSVSGLKVVKTSQSKQASKVEEKCEMTPSKRNTLEAIEKLQKQGLLVKKPRLEDVSNESDHSDECGDYTTEEPED